MFLQNLRARMNARLSGDREAGFTLIELLVVMLILGILAAIAIPSFFNQRDKANDADTKALVRTAQTATETYATDNGGAYTGAEPGDLTTIEPVLNDALELDVTPNAAGDGYTVEAKTENTGNVFKITRFGKAEDEAEEGDLGTVALTCTTGGNAGCPTDETWD